MKNNQPIYLVGGIICCILTVFGIAASVISLTGERSVMWLCDYGSIAILIAIACYAAIGYKVPHGNLLKYIMLFHALLRLFGILANVSMENISGIIYRAVGIGFTCYIAGRLSKAKENFVLMIYATCFLVAELVSDNIAGVTSIGMASPLIAWLDICVAYFLRYKEHKEAGFADISKN